MKLSIYNQANHDSILDAINGGAIYEVKDLNDLPNREQLKTHLHESSMANYMNANDHDVNKMEVENALYVAENALNCVGNPEDFVFVIMEGDVPLAQRVSNETKWEDIDSEAFLREKEIAKQTAEAYAYLKEMDYIVKAYPQDDEITLFFIPNGGGEIITRTVNYHDDDDIDLTNKTFDITVADKSGDYQVTLYNIIYNVPDIGQNRDFDWWQQPDVVSEDFLKFVKIHNELLNIEHWRGEAYQGPFGQGTSCYGDDIHQSLFAIRKIIGIGVGSYEEYNRNAWMENVEIIDGTYNKCSVIAYCNGGWAFEDARDNSRHGVYDSYEMAEQAMKDYYYDTFVKK